MKGHAIPWIVLVLLCFAWSTEARAQVDEIDVLEEAVVVENAFELHESNFDRWIFGNTGRAGTPKDQLEALLLLSLGEVDRCCVLTEAQKKKLILAGHGDIKHFMDRIAEARKVFEQLRHDQNNINAIYQETLPLAATLRSGLFGADSIFSKTILSTLDTEQAEHYRSFIQERNAFRHQAKIRLAITTMDQSIGMTADQRRRMIDLVIKEVKPADKQVQQYETQILMLKMSKIPDEKFRQILDESRMKALKQQFQQARGMEAFLKQNGFVEMTGD